MSCFLPRRCNDCYSTDLIERESYLVCRSCGLVSEEFAQYSLDYTHMTFADKEQIKEEIKNEDIFTRFEEPLHLTHTMMTTAREIMDQIKGDFKGDSRKMALLAASIFYASPRNITEISETVGIQSNLICKAVTIIFDKLNVTNKIVREKYIANSDSHNHHAMAQVNRMVNRLTFVTDNAEIFKIKRTVINMYEQFRSSDVIKPFKEEKLIATYVFMACEKLKVKDGTIKNVALACGANAATIKNIRSSLHSAK